MITLIYDEFVIKQILWPPAVASCSTGSDQLEKKKGQFALIINKQTNKQTKEKRKKERPTGENKRLFDCYRQQNKKTKNKRTIFLRE